MNKHIFENYAINWEELLSKPNLDSMLKAASKQSKTAEALARVDPRAYAKSQFPDEVDCPMYFGLFVEWLAEKYITEFCYDYNIQAIRMTAEIGSLTKDLGVDGQGVCITSQKGSLMTRTRRAPVTGSSVFLQVKGTLNKSKLYQANDGSRLTNFMTNAMTTAGMRGQFYQARYVLFTTGQGLHHSLEEMSNGYIEVINHALISKKINGNTVFLNKLRESVGLTSLPIEAPLLDAEAVYIQEQNDKEVIDV